MPGLIEERGRKVLGCLKALIELFRGNDLIEERLRNWFAGLVMFRVILQHFRPGRPHLVNLRRVLHEVARHARSAEPRIFYVRKHSMERVTELMKRSAHLIMGQQGWFTWRRFRDVQMIGDDRFGSGQFAL